MAEVVRVEGLAELEKKLLHDLPTATAFKALRGALVSAALPMVKAAKVNVPKDSGALEESIGRFSRKGNAGDRVATVFVGPKSMNKKAIAKAQASGREIKGIFYGAMVELGTKKMAPRPYLRPAFMSTKEAVVALFAKKLAANIEKAGKK